MSKPESEQVPAGAGGGKPDVPPGQDKPPKTDDEIKDEVSEETPSASDVLSFAREVFLRLVSTGLAPEHFKREPSFVGRQEVDRLWRHSLQIAEVWAYSGIVDVAKVHAEVTRKKVRVKKFPKGLEKKL